MSQEGYTYVIANNLNNTIALKPKEEVEVPFSFLTEAIVNDKLLKKYIEMGKILILDVNVNEEVEMDLDLFAKAIGVDNVVLEEDKEKETIEFKKIILGSTDVLEDKLKSMTEEEAEKLLEVSLEYAKELNSYKIKLIENKCDKENVFDNYLKAQNFKYNPDNEVSSVEIFK